MRSAINCPAYEMITLAIGGDVEVLNQILKHYDSYLSKASRRPFYDEYGRKYEAVDQELKGLIRTALMINTLKFKVKHIEEKSK